MAEKVRSIVGSDGQKLVELWAATALGLIPKIGSKEYIAALTTLAADADTNQRLAASRLLAERGFGQPKQEIEHSGEVAMPTRVIHEHQVVQS